MSDKSKPKGPAHRKHDPAAIAAKARKDAPKPPKSVQAVCVIGFRVDRKTSVGPGERVELPYADFRSLERVGKVVSADRFGESAIFDEPKKKRGRPKKDAEAE